jgi:hypothetical protein
VPHTPATSLACSDRHSCPSQLANSWGKCHTGFWRRGKEARGVDVTKRKRMRGLTYMVREVCGGQSLASGKQQGEGKGRVKQATTESA